MNLESIVAQIAQTIQKEANVDAIFGQARKLDEHVVIPVARVEVKLSAGGGSGVGPQLLAGIGEKSGEKSGEKPSEKDAQLNGPKGTGAGGGFEVHVIPLGFIRDGKDGAEFMAIDPTPEGLIGKVEHLLKNLRAGNGKPGEARS